MIGKWLVQACSPSCIDWLVDAFAQLCAESASVQVAVDAP